MILGLQKNLAADELRRAARFRFERDRGRFIVRRSLFRILLGRYTGLDPVQLRFAANDYGKPVLAPISEEETLFFNLSHSAGLGLFAFTKAGRIGVDIERVSREFEHEQVAERFFSAQERAVIRSLPPEDKAEAFYNCWTRKEAYIKAHGEGLSLPLDQFDVSLVPGEPARLLASRLDPKEVQRWKLWHLTPAPGFIGALAQEGQVQTLHCWHVDWAAWLMEFS